MDRIRRLIYPKNLKNWNFVKADAHCLGIPLDVISFSEEQTVDYGKELGRLLHPNSVVCFYGDLGAGKTTLIKGIINQLTQVSIEEVCSPTYSYLNIYEGKCRVYHFDLYRLQDHEAFLNLGFEEYFSAGGVCCVEWSERIEAIIPPLSLYVTIEHKENGGRKIFLEEDEVSKYPISDDSCPC